ncbi:MAG: hypothetical protein GY708_17275 [Actinomycetia bacterium]|nr:hypothetical protein [Actinomycetes bacterium]
MFRIFHRFLALMARLAVRRGRSKDLEIVVPGDQLTVLRRHRRRIARHWTHPPRHRVGLGHTTAPTTVHQILQDNNIDPTPGRSRTTWTAFLHSQAAAACDFLTIDTAFLHRYYVLFITHV